MIRIGREIRCLPYAGFSISDLQAPLRAQRQTDISSYRLIQPRCQFSDTLRGKVNIRLEFSSGPTVQWLKELNSWVAIVHRVQYHARNS